MLEGILFSASLEGILAMLEGIPVFWAGILMLEVIFASCW
jgi:hypothetical protein